MAVSLATEHEHWAKEINDTLPLGGNTLGMECLKARNLLADYAVAALEHIDAVNALTDIEELGSNGRVANAKHQIQQTSAKCQAARIALEKHNAEHQCLDEHLH